MRRRIETGEWRHTPPAAERARTRGGIRRRAQHRARGDRQASSPRARCRGRSGAAPSSSPRAKATRRRCIRRLVGRQPVDMMAVRMILEPRAAALAADAAPAPASSDAIAAAHAAAVKAGAMEAFERWDAELHQRIFAATRNDLLGHAARSAARRSATRISGSTSSAALSAPSAALIYCAEHEALVAALLRRDAASAAPGDAGAFAHGRDQPQHRARGAGGGIDQSGILICSLTSPARPSAARSNAATLSANGKSR